MYNLLTTFLKNIFYMHRNVVPFAYSGLWETWPLFLKPKFFVSYKFATISLLIIIITLSISNDSNVFLIKENCREIKGNHRERTELLES